MDCRQYRKLYKLSQKQFADKVGVCQGTVSKYENKKRDCKMIRDFLRHEENYRRVANHIYARNAKPALTECKPRISFFARLWGWLKW